MDPALRRLLVLLAGVATIVLSVLFLVHHAAVPGLYLGWAGVAAGIGEVLLAI
jgi:hypothetical protein